MEKIEFGVGTSMPVRPNERERTERFLSTVLGLRETLKTESYSCYRFPNGQIIGVTPDENAPTELDYENSIWLEIVSDDFEQTKKRVLEFGVREVNGGMKNAFFFNIPGGVVVRLLSQEMADEENLKC